MKVLGSSTALATGTTKFKTSGQHAVYVINNANASADITVRNAADDGDVGSIKVGAGASVTLHLADSQGVRGAADFHATAIANVGY